MPAITQATDAGQAQTLVEAPKPRTSEAQIRQVIDRWVAAFASKNAAEALALHAAGIVSFDIVPPLEYRGAESYRKAWDAAFAMFDGPITMELRNLEIVVGDGVAFSHSFNRFQATTKDGLRADYWFRWTAGFQRIDGRWLISHDHTSLPTDFDTGRSRQDLEP